MCSRPSVCAAGASAKSDSTTDAATEGSEMSRTEDVSRALSEVLTCGPPGSASVRSAIRGCPARHSSHVRFSTCAACHGCTGSTTRSPSRSSRGHAPVTRHSRARTGTSPSSTSGRCSGP
ncbi:hypothetical protein QF034_006609 [Streptomyces africanus]|uniref:Uncharacterized protein n=1 Tax=Streptomyces africanus TaxID=231024 RepID=A0ABU0QYA2_9ACTN|nr:hypothetical protein [Streptomyces africanus]